MHEPLTAAIRQYLQRHFPEHHLQVDEPADGRGPTFSVSRGDAAYILRLSPELASMTPTAVVALLDEWDVAAEIRRQEGQPLQLTGHGIRLESAN